MTTRGGALGGARAVVRIVDLSFKLTGISEQNKEIQGLVHAAQRAISILTVLYMTYRMVMAGMGPVGWLLLGATVLSQVAMVAGEFSDTEEVISRGK